MAEPANSTTRARHPNWFNIGRAGAEIACGLYCIGTQFNTTRDSVFGLMQASTQIPVGMSPEQLLNFLQGNSTKLNVIAFTIALVTQIVFWWAALPPTRNGHNNKLRKGVALSLLALEILTDLQYASGTNTIINGDITRIFMTGGYAWLGIILFALCISFGSSFVFLNGIRVLGNVFEGTPD